MNRLNSDKYKAEEEKELLSGDYKSKSDISNKGIKIALAFAGIIIVFIGVALLFIK